jgi:3-dehydroquinate synthetase
MEERDVGVRHHTSNLFKQLPTNNIVLENGEENKNLKSLLRILSTASDNGMARDSRFIGFGGELSVI